jgi:hypothetical protein
MTQAIDPHAHVYHGLDLCTLGIRAERARFERVEDIGQLAGRYELTVADDSGRHVTGALTLVRNAFRSPAPDIAFVSPLRGTFEADITRVWPVHLAYSAAQSDSSLPGVQALYDLNSHALAFVLGAARNDSLLFQDIGVILRVEAANEIGFKGVWDDGSAAMGSAPMGHFCAVRRPI